MDAKLEKKFNQLNKQGRHREVVAMIEQIPESERDWDMISWYIRELNNSERLEDAVSVSLHFQERGKNDPKWYYRLGYAYIYLNRYDEAESILLRGKELAYGSVTGHIDELLDIVEGKKRVNALREASIARRAANLDPNKLPFEGFDFTEFWDNCDYALKEYVGAAVTDEMIAAAEKALGYKLPASYIHLMKLQNGGISNRTEYFTETPTSWAPDSIAISGIFGLDASKRYSLLGELGSRFMIEEWGYPDIGISICDCPSAGHDMVFLDYRVCGASGEPEVVHIDQEGDYEITWLAVDFESFIRGLVNEDEIEDV